MSERDPHALARQVEQAFDAARSGDFGPSAELQRAGAAVVPLLRPYLKSPDEDVRRQAVALAGEIGGEAAASLLAAALADPSAEVSGLAAARLYERYDPARPPGGAELGRALRDSAALRSGSAAAALLLSYFPGPDTEEALRRLREAGPDAQTKLRPWSPPVPAALPAEVALSRLGDGEARRAVMRRVEAGDQAELELLLEAIGEVDAPEVLHALKGVLGDEREVSSGLPSGAEPRRRLADLAVEALVRRLGLRVGFELSGQRRYSGEEVEEVRAGVNASLPR